MATGSAVSVIDPRVCADLTHPQESTPKSLATEYLEYLVMTSNNLLEKVILLHFGS